PTPAVPPARSTRALSLKSWSCTPASSTAWYTPNARPVRETSACGRLKRRGEPAPRQLLSPLPEHPAALDHPWFPDGHEGLGVPQVDLLEDHRQVAPAQHGVDDLHPSLATQPRVFGDAEAAVAQRFRELHPAVA